MLNYSLALLVLLGLGGTFSAEAENNRASKILPVFQVVRFPNDACVITGGARNGTCYTAEECTTKGGTSGGSCAQGFGVCCTFVVGCGSTSSENCTYFESTGTTVANGACRSKICKCSTDICQIRLDFLAFSITGPSTLTISVGKSLNGQILPAEKGEVAVSTASQCLTDKFTISGQSTLPVICGVNTDTHVYFDASDACNTLDFQFGNTPFGVSSIASRSFKIKVTQLSCFSDNLAPSGCDQWFYGTGAENIVKTFNFDGGRHLSDQQQTICVRREGNNCKICWVAIAAIDVQVTLKTTKASAKVKGSLCCAYGSDGKAIGTGGGQDCIMIPGAEKVGGTVVPDTQCGNNVGLVTASAANLAAGFKTVCSRSFPFRISFRSDSWESAAAAISEAKANIGFKLKYTQSTVCA